MSSPTAIARYAGLQRGGAPGRRSKAAVSLENILKKAGCSPVRGMCLIAENKLPCGVCRGIGKTRYKLAQPRPDCEICADGGPGELPDRRAKECWACDGQRHNQTLGLRTCESCYGTLYEACAPELRGKMWAELAKYMYPQLKAIEIAGPDGGAVPLGVRVRYVSSVEELRQQPGALEVPPDPAQAILETVVQEEMAEEQPEGESLSE